MRAFRWLAPSAFRGLYHTLARVTISGRENIPARGPHLVIFNHTSYYDSPLLISFWPYPLETLGAARTLDKPVLGHIMRGWGTVRVERDEYDRRPLQIALGLLEAGRPVLIAPEGGRSHRPGMRLARPGAAYLALKAGVPVLPVGITGTEALFTRWRPAVGLTVGEAFRLPPALLSGPERRQNLAEATRSLMAHLAAVLPPEYRGAYG